MPKHDIIVIGASLGGMSAIRQVCAALPADFPASVFIVWHGTSLPNMLADLLNRAGPLPAAFAKDGQPIEPRRIYVAPLDHHLVLTFGYVRLSHGARENRFRPAIDPLFRSAAKVYGPRVVSVVLTGLLDDGTQGSWYVKRYGGVTIAQDPADAEAPAMPATAIEEGTVQHIVPLSQVAPLLVRLANEEGGQPTQDTGSTPMLIDKPKDVEELHPPGNTDAPEPFTCPECNGSVWKMKGDGPLRFECHVGHQYSGPGMSAAKQEEVELALWTALRVLKESAALHGTMAERARTGRRDISANLFQRTHDEMQRKIDIIRNVLEADSPGGKSELNK